MPKISFRTASQTKSDRLRKRFFRARSNSSINHPGIEIEMVSVERSRFDMKETPGGQKRRCLIEEEPVAGELYRPLSRGGRGPRFI